MRLFDLHCDTLTELYDRGESFEENTCHIRSAYFSRFASYSQICAVFSKIGMDNDGCYERFFKVVKYFEERGVTFLRESREAEASKTPALFLSVEDGRLLNGDISRLERLYDFGVRFLTPLWGGATCIGGSHDTEDGLTDFGARVISECFRLGIVPDISHASEKSADEILSAGEGAGKAVIASHSNAFGVFPHMRNLKDAAALRVKALGGIIGVSFAPQHLAGGSASVEDVFRHLDYYLSLVGDGVVALGGDFDGIETTPEGLSCQGELYNLYNTMMKHNYSEELADRLFYKNAADFIRNNL